MEFNKLLSLVLGFVILILAFVWISNRFRASQAEKQGENPTTVVSQTSPSQTQTTTTTTPSAQGSSITPSATPKEESNSRNPLAFLFNRNDKNESDKQSSKEAPLSNEDSSQTNNTTATIKTGQTNNEKQIRISQGKTKGTFPTILIEDFPIPPEISGSGEKIETSILTKNLPSLLFTAALDESRPVLTGVNFITEEDNLTMVSTDGFRLSILTLKKQTGFKPMIIPANFLKEIIQYLSEKEETIFKYDEKNKIISFETKKGTFYSRLIEGDFPPYKKVLPEEKKTTIKLKRDDLLKKTKMISIFAREQSSVVVFDFKKDGLTISPKKQIGEENKTTQEIEIEGEEMRVAFNYKYLVDFLNNSEGETTIIDLLRPDAPVVFKSDKNKNFIHIIMPVRIQDVV